MKSDEEETYSFLGFLFWFLWRISFLWIFTVFGHIIITVLSLGHLNTISEDETTLINLFSIKKESEEFLIGLGYSTFIGFFIFSSIVWFIVS